MPFPMLQHREIRRPCSEYRLTRCSCNQPGGSEQSRLTLKSLRDQRTQVAEWYGSLKSSSAGAWEQMKTGFSSANSALHDAW